jgi:heme/copper-type cytochrome/quinol oxidase subunit 2
MKGRWVMKKYMVIFMALFLVTFVSLYCFAAGSIDDQHKGHQHGVAKDETLELSGKIENGIRAVEVKASRYKFEPDPIVAKLGEKVRLIVTSTDVTHGLAISEFKINLSVPAGKTKSVEFVVGKMGTFHAYCSVYCGPGHGHMHGRFVVIK